MIKASIANAAVHKFDQDGVSIIFLRVQPSFERANGGSPYRTTYRRAGPVDSWHSQAPLAAHVSDVIALYVLLVSKILQGSAIPSGARGYYFATAHRIPWWETLQRLAIFLHARGLVTSKSVSTWPSDEMAAESLGFPRHFVRGMGTAT